MPIYSYNELIASARRGEGFAPKAARDEAKKLEEKLRKAAEALSRTPETKELADNLTGFANAVKNVSVRDLTRPNTRDLARKGLETLNALPEFLRKKDPSGVSGYEQITRALKEQGESAEEFRGNL